MSTLKNSQILVLGGSGFIGRHLVRRLVTLGARVTVFDRHSPDIDDIQYIQGDLSEVKDFTTLLKGQHFLFHLVSTTQPASSNIDPHFDIETNLLPAVDLLHAAVKTGVGKVIFVSSGGTVYGVPEYVPIDELHPTNPICSYGIGKLAIEKYLQLFHHLHQLDYVTLRMSNPYGPGQLPGRGQGVVAEFVSRALRGDTVEVFGDGSVIRDFIYIADAVDALIAAVEQPVRGVFNIGSGQGVSIRELLDTIRMLSSQELHVHYGEGRPFDVPSNVLSISRAQELLRWSPKVSLAAGIKMIFATAG